MLKDAISASKNLLPDLKMRHGKSEGKSLRMTKRNDEGRMWNCI